MDGSSVRQPPPLGQQRVPHAVRLFYGLGAVSEGIQNTAFNVFLLFFYNQVLGVPGRWTGLAIFLALCVDAVMDPLIGSLSDGWRSRLGRRHPFLYAAAVPLALCFYLLFRPPAGLPDAALFAWLLCFSVGVRLSMTLYMIPSNAMVPELTADYDERTTLVAWRYLFAWAGGLSISLLAYLHFFATRGDGSDGRLDPAGYAGFGTACALLAAAAVWGSALGTHRVIPTLARPADGHHFTLRRFASEVREVLASPSYRSLIGAALFASVAGGFSDLVGLYVNTYFWEFTTDQIAFLVYALVPAVLLGTLAARPLTARFDKKRAALGLAGFAIGIGPLPIFLRLVGAMPANGSPWLLPIIVVHAVVSVACVVAIGITVSSMLADVADEGELLHGKRQEGMYTATISFAAKSSSGVGGLVAGLALDVIGFPRGAAPGSVPPGKVAALGLAVGPGLFLLFLVTLVFVARYRITRERHREILDELERRHRAARLEAPTADPLPGV
jgi:GPH family glycoside/pentoside/hexuronide:cation symporter